MTIDQYLSNPYGKGAAFSAVGTQKDSLNKQFDSLKSHIHCTTYLYRNTAIFHVLVPSQKDISKNYDVVIEIPFREDTQKEVNISDHDFKVFSNCPSFIFTYANIFYSRKMMCTWLVSRYESEVRKRLPSQSNPYGVIGFERSLFLAMKYLKSSGLLNAVMIRNSPVRPKTYGQISENIRTQAQIMGNVRKTTPQKDQVKDRPNSSKVVSRKSKGNIEATPTTGTTKTTKTHNAKTKRVKSVKSSNRK